MSRSYTFGAEHFGRAIKNPAYDDKRFAGVRDRLHAFLEVQRNDYLPDGVKTLDRIERALAWAIEAHRKQWRPDGSPYIMHILDVASAVSSWYRGLDDDVVIAALLHDALEDCPEYLAARASEHARASAEPARAAIEEHFGAGVLELVEAVTNPDFEAEIKRDHGFTKHTPEYNAVLVARYATHFVEIFTHAPLGASAIKISDFLDNATQLDKVASDPVRYPWFVRKYGPCVKFLIDFLPRHDGADHPIKGAVEIALPRLEEAWAKYYAPGAPS